MADVMRSTDERQDGLGGEDRLAPRLRRASVWRWLAGGLAAGLVWGVVARLWMRFVTDVPEFSWSGTLFILGVTSLAGLSLGAVELLRRRGAGAWRLVPVLPAVVMFAGAGMVMAPSAVLGGFVLSGRGPRWLRAVATVLALAPLVLFVTPDPLPGSLLHRVLAVAWYLVLVGALAVGWSGVWRRPDVRPAG
jgi:hypothetical protein